MSVPYMEVQTGNLPDLSRNEDGLFPTAPMVVGETGVDEEVLLALMLRLASTTPQLTTDWAAAQAHLTVPVAEELLQILSKQELLSILGQVGVLNYRYTITQRGRERASQLFAISGYVGPAPVSLEAYNAMLEWQMENTFQVHSEEVNRACAELSLDDTVVDVAGISLAARRSLFLYGPTGNGKTRLAQLLHRANAGEMWIPHCIHIDHSIVRVFDPKCHEVVPDVPDCRNKIDHRWVRVKRPFVAVGGEMTIDSLDLIYSNSRRYYEAPPHFKANGGTFLIDDFGRQRVAAEQLLNRWIVPLENQIDYLTLNTGQKIRVPFSVMLIIATNINPDVVMEAAFLRRIGYRVYLGMPSEARYSRIFEQYAARYGFEIPPGLIAHVLARYGAEDRDRLCCHPRDLIERARDVCRYRKVPEQLSIDILDFAWDGYFGSRSAAERAGQSPEHAGSTLFSTAVRNV